MKRLFAIATFFAAALATAAPAHADVPGVIPFSGRLVKDQTPVSGTQTVTFRLFDAQADGMKIWEETQPGLTVTDGLVYAELGAKTPIPADKIDGNLFLEVEISDGTGTSYTFSPRLPVASVPFAIHASDSDTLGGLAATDLQKRVTGQCPGGSIAAIADDGTVTCHADPTPPSYTGTGPIAVTGTSISLAGCSAGDVYHWSGSAWTCGPDQDTNTTYLGSGPISVNGNTIGLTSSGCTSGQVLKWNGTAWGCAPDLDTNTTYTGANAIAVNGTTIGLSSSTCSVGDVWKWTASGWSCDPDLDTNTTYSGSGPISVNGTTIGLSSSGCSSGYVLKWNGSAWACSAESVTSYTGTAPVSVSGTAIGLSGATCSPGDVYHWTGTSWTCSADVDTNTSYTGSSGISVSGNSIALSSSGCQPGYVWKWSGTAWACGPDLDTNTTYTGSAPVAVNGTTVSLTQCPANQIYKENASGTGFACAADNDTTYSAGTGISVAGTTVSLSTSGCAAGYVWKFNGSSFACVPDGNSGIATFYNSAALRPNSAGQVAHVSVNTAGAGNLMVTLSYGLAVKTHNTACHVPFKVSLTPGDTVAGSEGYNDYFWPNTMETMDSSTAYGTWPGTITAMFPVAAGAHTVYFNSGQIGAPNCSDFLWTNVALTVMYVPNSIGTGSGAP